MSGCSTVYSEHPLSDPTRPGVDERLVGTWVPADPGDDLRYMLTVTTSPNDGAKILVLDRKVGTAGTLRSQEFSMTCTEIKGTSYCSVHLPKGAYDFFEYGNTVPSDARYAIGRYEFFGEGDVAVYGMSTDHPKTETLDGVYIIRLDTPALRQAVANDEIRAKGILETLTRIDEAKRDIILQEWERELSNEDIREIELILADLEYKPGEVDGNVSSETIEAIGKFQTEVGLTKTGDVSLALLEASIG